MKCTQLFPLSQFKNIKQKGNIISITTKYHKLISKKIKIQLILRVI